MLKASKSIHAPELGPTITDHSGLKDHHHSLAPEKLHVVYASLSITRIAGQWMPDVEFTIVCDGFDWTFQLYLTRC
jgi:hypothetical protein